MKTNKHYAIIRAASFMWLGTILFSCTYKTQEIGPEEDCSTKIPENVSFSKDIIPIFEQNCITSGCHSGNVPAGNLNLESSKAYASLSRKGSGYIDTINPKSSVLNLTLISVTNPMPPTGKLDNCTLEMIQRWMAQKAKNN